MTDAIMVMVTCRSSRDATDLANVLLEERLVACVNIAGRIRSLFFWEGAPQRESESLLLMKTQRDLFDKLRERVEELHSYDVPEIVAVPLVCGNKEYLDWIEKVTADGAPGDSEGD
jgi:periplasmic divalent cation tolerance protein